MSQNLEHLKQQKEKLEAQLALIRKEILTLKTQTSLLTPKAETLGKQILELNSQLAFERRARMSRIVMTDHAFLRYLQRKIGVNIEQLKDDILKKFPQFVPDGNFNIDGVVWVVKNNTIVTILSPEMSKEKQTISHFSQKVRKHKNLKTL